MGKKEKEEEEDSDAKSQLVTDICFTASRFIACRHRCQHARKPAFIDWYLLLRVEEDCGSQVIRKRFRQLALQLHPDKNKHPKAEVAFKLVSEAYACLSDKEKRKAFNCERQANYCSVCDGRFQSENLGAKVNRKRCNSKEESRSYRVLQTLKVIKRFKEEAKVIEKCLRVHADSKKEFPLFDPSNYATVTDYPHIPTRIFVDSNRDFWNLQSGNFRSHDCRRGKRESPVYEIRTEPRSVRTRPTKPQS